MSSFLLHPPPLFSQRYDWADVVPLNQYDSPGPVVQISDRREYEDATGYFRGIVKAGEKSPRVLELTESIIRLNPYHFPAWRYRYATLLSIEASLDEELELMDELAVAGTVFKMYQIWNYRRLLQTRVKKPAAELTFLSKLLEMHPKNYHTWSHRQWLLAYFGPEGNLWKDELSLVDKMLENDVQNNSAWHHRFFILWGFSAQIGAEGDAIVSLREIKYTKCKIALAPDNASAWNYLRGVLTHNSVPFSSVSEFVERYTLSYDSFGPDNSPVKAQSGGACPAAMEFLADVYETEDSNKSIKLWKSLANKHDTKRGKYWEYRIRRTLEVTDRHLV
ncbi:hypothetical protein B0H34DRAFT_659597 [Crassisporium funariophilum]|nr:hypothetical protein B0H34DRAFT_659597 [Crassisporium funariophilum]